MIHAPVVHAPVVHPQVIHFSSSFSTPTPIPPPTTPFKIPVFPKPVPTNPGGLGGGISGIHFSQASMVQTHSTPVVHSPSVLSSSTVSHVTVPTTVLHSVYSFSHRPLLPTSSVFSTSTVL